MRTDLAVIEDALLQCKRNPNAYTCLLISDACRRLDTGGYAIDEEPVEAQALRLRGEYFDSCVGVLARADVLLVTDEFGQWELGAVWRAHAAALERTFGTLEAMRVECMRTFYAVKRGEFLSR